MRRAELVRQRRRGRPRKQPLISENNDNAEIQAALAEIRSDRQEEVEAPERGREAEGQRRRRRRRRNQVQLPPFGLNQRRRRRARRVGRTDDFPAQQEEEKED